MKKCLFCAEEIQDEAIKCRYCGSMLTAAAGTAPASAAADLAPEVAQLVAAGKKIDAIKRVRQRTGAGLKDAKTYVESIAAGRAPEPLSVLRAMPPQPGSTDAGRGFAILFFLLAVGVVLYWWMRGAR